MALHRVENTFDKDKRASFKEQLTARLVTPPVEEVGEPEVRLNGVPIGGTLFHTIFGEGSLLSIDDTKVVVFFDCGERSFVPSAARSLLSPFTPEVRKMDRFDEGYIEPAVRTPITTTMDVKEVSFSEFDVKPEPEPKVVPIADRNTLNGVAVGGTLYHPSLGAGTLKFVDKNTVVLAVVGQDLTLASRQAEAILSPHAPKDFAEDKFDQPVFAPIVRMSDGIVPETKNPVKPEPKAEPNVTVTTTLSINGIPVGGTLYHKQFGAGVLKEITRTEVVVEFSWKTVSFIPSTATMHLSPIAPQAPQRDRFEEPFIDPIVRENPVFIDVESRDVSTIKALPPVQEEKPSSLQFVNRKVWHPDFGACLVLSVDPHRNEIVLEINNGTNVTLALRALESKLAILPDDTDLVSGKKPTQIVV